MDINIRRTWDIETVFTIVNNETIYNDITEDDITQPIVPDVINDIYALMIADKKIIGCYRFKKASSVNWQIHALVLPEFRDEYAKKSAIAIVKWSLVNLPGMTRLTATIPEIFPHIIKFTELGGFKKEAVIEKSYSKNGEIIDQIQLVAHRDDLENISGGKE